MGLSSIHQKYGDFVNFTRSYIDGYDTNNDDAISFDEFVAKGIAANYEDVLVDVKARDERDANRKDAPMKPADDAIILDTSNLGIEEVFQKTVSLIEERI